MEVPVVNVDLAETAQRISKERSISFGDALFIARREMADTVTRNTGSPLRDQQQSTTPQASEVRTAVIQGMNAVAPSWQPGDNPGVWAATTGRQDIRAAVSAVSAKLQGLGLGPQITSSLATELDSFLGNLLQGLVTQSKNLPISDVIAQCGDHVQKVYADALANKVSTQVWDEAQRISDGSHSAVDVNSIVLRDRAIQVSRRRNISFGEALSFVRHNMADDVADPQQIGAAVTGALNDFFSQELGGKQEKININMLGAKELVTKALSPFQLGSPALDKLNADLQEFLGSLPNAVSASDAKAFAAKGGARVQKLYGQYLASARG